MNIFFTDRDPIIAANQHTFIHRRKMIVEYAQLLSTAHHILDSDQAIQGIYKCTHKNHPSAIYCRSTTTAYTWVWTCAKRLCELYTLQTGKIHASEKVLNKLEQYPINIAHTNKLIDPPVAAPDKYKSIAVFNGAPKAYQNYLNDKFSEWQTRDKPIKVEFSTIPYWYKSKM